LREIEKLTGPGGGRGGRNVPGKGGDWAKRGELREDSDLLQTSRTAQGGGNESWIEDGVGLGEE